MAGKIVSVKREVRAGEPLIVITWESPKLDKILGRIPK